MAGHVDKDNGCWLCSLLLDTAVNGQWRAHQKKMLVLQSGCTRQRRSSSGGSGWFKMMSSVISKRTDEGLPSNTIETFSSLSLIRTSSGRATMNSSPPPYLGTPEVSEPQAPNIRSLRRPLDTFIALQLTLRVIRHVDLEPERVTFEIYTQLTELCKGLGKLYSLVKELDTKELTPPQLREDQELMSVVEDCLRAAWDYAALIFHLDGTPEAAQFLSSGSMEVRKKMFDLSFLPLLCSQGDIFALQDGHDENDDDQGDVPLYGILKILDKPLGNLVRGFFKAKEASPEETETEQASIENVSDTSTNQKLNPFPAQKSVQYRIMAEKLGDDVIRSYRFPGEYSRLEEIPDPCPGTLRWILDQGPTDLNRTDPDRMVKKCSAFAAWLRSTSSRANIYWISGHPGAGKSVLMKALITYLERNPQVFVDRKEPWLQVSKPVILSHFFSHDPRQHRVMGNFQGMLQHLLLQLFRRYPAKVSRCFAESYTAHSCNGMWYGQMWVLGLFRDTLEAALREVQEAGPVYIFLDGVSGFDEECHEFIEDLAGANGVKICVAARPEGRFYGWQQQSLHLSPGEGFGGPYKYPTIFIEDFAHDDLQAFCKARLERLPSTDRSKITARIMEKCGNSLVSAEDIYEEEMSYIFEPPASNKRTMPRSRSLFNAMLERNKRDNARGQQMHLQRLSFYLNVIHAHEKSHDFASARNGRSLSLLELALCEELADRQEFEQAVVPWDITITMPNLCHKISTLAQHIKDCYPFILMKTMSVGVDDFFTASTGSLLRQAATMKVTLLHQDLHWWLEWTEEGLDLLNIDMELRHCQMLEWRLKMARQKLFAPGSSKGQRKRKIPQFSTTEERKAYWVSWYRTRWLVTASLWEHVLVMPRVMEEGAHPERRRPRPQQPQKAEQGDAAVQDEEKAAESEMPLKKWFRRVFLHRVKRPAATTPTSPPRAATPPKDDEAPESPEKKYHPYQEHVKLAQEALSSLDDTLEEEEMFPQLWVAKYSPNPIEKRATPEDDGLEGDTDVEDGEQELFLDGKKSEDFM